MIRSLNMNEWPNFKHIRSIYNLAYICDFKILLRFFKPPCGRNEPLCKNYGLYAKYCAMIMHNLYILGFKMF